MARCFRGDFRSEAGGRVVSGPGVTKPVTSPLIVNVVPSGAVAPPVKEQDVVALRLCALAPVFAVDGMVSWSMTLPSESVTVNVCSPKATGISIAVLLRS
jgi:hypothetical protein